MWKGVGVGPGGGGSSTHAGNEEVRRRACRKQGEKSWTQQRGTALGMEGGGTQ